MICYVRRGVTWQNAKLIGEAWADEHLPRDLSGAVVQLVAFKSDEDCRFFYADRDAGFHRMITTAIARVARQRGGKTFYLPVTRLDYAGKATDPPSKRTQYADQLAGVRDL